MDNNTRLLLLNRPNQDRSCVEWGWGPLSARARLGLRQISTFLPTDFDPHFRLNSCPAPHLAATQRIFLEASDGLLAESLSPWTSTFVRMALTQLMCVALPYTFVQLTQADYSLVEYISCHCPSRMRLPVPEIVSEAPKAMCPYQSSSISKVLSKLKAQGHLAHRTALPIIAFSY